MKKDWETYKQRTKELNEEMAVLKADINKYNEEVKGKIYYHHIPRTQNKLADALVKSALFG